MWFSHGIGQCQTSFQSIVKVSASGQTTHTAKVAKTAQGVRENAFHLEVQHAGAIRCQQCLCKPYDVLGRSSSVQTNDAFFENWTKFPQISQLKPAEAAALICASKLHTVVSTVKLQSSAHGKWVVRGSAALARRCRQNLCVESARTEEPGRTP
jgi:hypothetical protein